MIDIHTHVLAHLDDGARDTATSVALLKAEIAQGVTQVVLTPHYYGKKHPPRRFLEKRQEMYEHLKAKIPQGIEVRLGAEVHFTGINVPDFDELCLLAIEGTKYILLEFPFTSVWEKSLLDTVADFISETGYTPIIAHVERYREALKKPAIVSELVHMGCLIQVNTSSFLEKSTRKFAFALLKHGLVHCIGSDSHDLGGRAPNHALVREELAKAGYLAEWERAQNIMRQVLEGEQVRVENEKPVKKFLWKYV